MTSKFVEIVPPFHRQGNCIPFTAIRWHDFGDRPSFGRLFGQIFHHSDPPPVVFNWPSITLAYNLANFMRTLALPKEVEHWSLTTLREKLVKIGAKVVRHDGHRLSDALGAVR